MSDLVRTFPGQLVAEPTGATLYFRLSVTNVAATLASLLPNGVIPTIAAPNVSGPATAKNYKFTFVDFQSETDPSSVQVRFTAGGQTVPTATLGFVIAGQSGGSMTRVPADPSLIQLIGSAAGPTFVQCYLGIGAIG